MLDLTKPIRWKFSNTKVLQITRGNCHVMVEWVTKDSGIDCLAFTHPEMERKFENIPEPRKPKSYRAMHYPLHDRYGELVEDLTSSIIPVLMRYGPGYHKRFIEWPEGAPLPDMPEGFT